MSENIDSNATQQQQNQQQQNPPDAGAGQQNPPPPAPASAAPPTPRPHRNDKGQLTRHGMEEAIRAGGSVIHKGVVVSRLQDLPSEAELAQGDEQAERDALAAIDDRQASLDRERALITGRRSPAKPKK